MLLEDHHGGSVDVDVVLAGQLLSASESNVHIPKGQVIPVGKGRQLGERKCYRLSIFSSHQACDDFAPRTHPAV